MALTAKGLTTVEKVQRYADIETGTNDELIKDLIDQVTDEVETGIGAKIIVVEYEDEVIDGWYSEYLSLKHRPVVTFTSLKLNDVLVTASSYQVNLPAGLVVQVTDGATTSWTKGTRNFKATYTAGYATIPGGLERIATRIVARALETSSKGRIGKSAEALSTGGTVDFEPDIITDAEWKTLKSYGSVF